MWALANTVQTVVDALGSRSLRYAIKPISTMVGNYFDFRHKRRSYTFVPEVSVFRYMHKLLFSGEKRIIK